MAGGDLGPLSADDARIFGLESATITGHTLKLIVFEPGTGALDIDALRDAVAERLVRQPLATQRVDVSGIEASWVDAGEFDIADHVRRREGPKWESRADLWRAVGDLMAEHLDHRRPLWTFDVFGPTDDGREAIAARIHHAMADGIAGVRFLEDVLFDSQPAPADGARPGVRAADSQLSPLEEGLRMPATLRREFGHRASLSPFDRPIGAARELAFTVVPLAELKAIGHTRQTTATVNDVLLAIVAGGVRDWLGGERSAGQLRVQIPVSLHHRGEAADDLGNRDSFMNVDLPVGEADPLTRLDLIAAETRQRKLLGDARELYDLFHALGRIKHLDEAVQRLAGSAREFSLTVSNVPGPAVPVSVAGRPVRHLFSSSEPAVHHALRISAISLVGDIGIGLCTDPRALPGVARLAEAIETAHAQLADAALG